MVHGARFKIWFFYNVFRATRYKTTSLPAALNQARRIDTLDVFYLYITCKLVLYIYGDHSYALLCYEMQFKNKADIYLNRLVNVWHFSREMFVQQVIFMTMCFWPFTWKILMESAICLKPQYYARYHTYCITLTILYFVFLFFLGLYHTHTQYVGENVCCNEEC